MMTLRICLATTLTLVAAAGCKTKDSESKSAAPKTQAAAEPEQAPPAPAAEPPPPELAEIDLSPAGDTWKGLAMKAPAGSKVVAVGSVGVAVLGPDGSGWGIEVLNKDAFDAFTKEHRALPKFKSAALSEADRYIGTDEVTSSLSNFKVVVRTKVGEQVYTCKDYRVISSRPLADSYAEACASLNKK